MVFPRFLPASRVALGLALVAAPLLAQMRPASVHGVVRDAAGRPLARVEVELLDVGDGRSRTARSDLAGRWGFDELPAGRYSLAFFLDGYSAVKLPARELLPDSPVEISVRLEPLGPPLTRPRAGVETIALEYGLAREQIAALPVVLGSEGRTSIDKLALLTPGLTPVQPIEIDPFRGIASAPSANGSRRSAINYQIDAAANNAQNRLTEAQAATFAPTPEALETFRAATHTYSSRDGRNAGAVLAATTRAGSERWHGQFRGVFRPRGGEIESFDGARDALRGGALGGQFGGPLWTRRKLYVFADLEAWSTRRANERSSAVLSAAERSGDLSGLGQPVPDPQSPSTPFPNGVIPASRLDPLVRKYLDAFVPEPNLPLGAFVSRQSLGGGGQTATGKLDWRPGAWSVSAGHVVYRNDTDAPIGERVLAPSPGLVENRRQLANNGHLAVAWTPAPWFAQVSRAAGQRLSIARWEGRPDYRDVTANEFGFDFASFNFEPGTIPDVTLYDDQGFVRLRIAPFLASERSVQTTYQFSHDLELRARGHAFRAGVLYQRGIWPFGNTENFAGSFSFPAPPEPPIRARPNGLRDLLLGTPGQYRLQTPRALDLSWRELAVHGEAELRPARSLLVTVGLRAESQPPAVDSQDRIAAFRAGAQSERFPNTLPGLIFGGDRDGDRGTLPRATVEPRGFNVGPRVGLAWSPGAERGPLRPLLGDSGRSVLRASYGLFYDFGAFAGSSAAALFQATYPPFSSDNRFDFPTPPADGFRRPFAALPSADPAQFLPQVVRYPILAFDRDFENARAHQWNLGLQRLLPGGVFVSAVYVGTRSLRLQRQRELNTFVRNPLRPFAFVRNMRLFSRYTDIRQIESTGDSRYNALQIRANRYLRRGLAFDAAYSWSRSDDNGSRALGAELATEPWAVSGFDRRHNLTAAWTYAIRPRRSWIERQPWIDRWNVSGVWRWRSGLPLDIRQNEDPTFTFENVGRPDLIGEFRALDPSVVRTFSLADGRAVTGRFAFDPTVFRRVEPTDFGETRPGNLGRNPFRMRGYQQWDLRIARVFAPAEDVSVEFGLDLMNAFGARNWDAPFANIDHPYFGIVRTEGLRRTYQANVRLEF